MQGRSFLCRNEAERARLLDMSQRMHRIELGSVAIFLVFVAFGIPAFGWLPFLFLGLGPVALVLVEKRAARSTLPEYALFAGILVTQLLSVVAIALAHGPRVYMLSIFIFPAAIACVVFPRRAALLGTGISVALMLVAGLGITTHAVLHTPPTLLYPLATLVCAAIWASATRDADIESRSTAVVDKLTGALNRTALEARVAELDHQGRVGGAPIGLIVADVDGFKGINDQHGHAVGDEVLNEIARRMRASLGAFESLYRVGGEEFVVLLPDTDAERAMQLAERLREVVGGEPAGEVPVTLSLGVTATAHGEAFDYERLFERADGALYAAKRLGRNQARLASAPVPEEEPAAALPTRRHTDAAPKPVWRERVVEEQTSTGNWLIADSLQRAHMLDVLRRLDRVGHVGNLLVLVTLLGAAPFFGWWPILPAVLGGVAFQLTENSLDRWRRPEFALGLAWILASMVYASAFFLATKPPVPALPFMVLMNVGFSAVFPVRGVVIGALTQAALMAAVAFGTFGDQVSADPVLLVMPLTLLFSIALLGTTVGQSALEHRGAAVVDKLTGLLNRTALDSRAAELEHQVTLSGEPLALILGDLDGFKAVNDLHGHAIGDVVLCEAAVRMRAQVRAFDSIYRLGGDEFVILLPGVEADGALELGERLRHAVRDQHVAGLPVTISLGVAAGSAADPRSFKELFEAADHALYEAKRAGRDRVASSAAWPMSTR